jgi:hypothetical protein
MGLTLDLALGVSTPDLFHPLHAEGMGAEEGPPTEGQDQSLEAWFRAARRIPVKLATEDDREGEGLRCTLLMGVCEGSLLHENEVNMRMRP